MCLLCLLFIYYTTIISNQVYCERVVCENKMAALASLVCRSSGGMVCGSRGGMVCGTVCGMVCGCSGGMVCGTVCGVVCSK